jgi:hypothetical protein
MGYSELRFEYSRHFHNQNREHLNICFYIPIIVLTDLTNRPGNSSVNMVQHTTIEEAVFPVDPVRVTEFVQGSYK